MKKVLVIDDDPNIRAALAIRLRAAGHHVIIHPTGFRGLVSVMQDRPDLIISDIWMPEGMGFSVAERLDEIGLGGIPIIFMTAGRQPGLRETAGEIGAAGFFEKPFDAHELLKAVDRALLGFIPASLAYSPTQTPVASAA